MDERQQKAIEKVRKLIALSQSSNEHEAALAAERAQAILSEYNLQMTDIADKPALADEMGFDHELESESRPWRRRLGVMVGELYFSQYFFTFRKQATPSRACGYIRYDRHCFVGAKQDILVARMMFQYLTETVVRLSIAGAQLQPTKERTSYMTSFRHACASRLCYRIGERIASAKQSGVPAPDGKTMLPALLNLYETKMSAAKQKMTEVFGALTIDKRQSKLNNMKGAIDGNAAGEQIGLDQQVASDDNKRIAGR